MTPIWFFRLPKSTPFFPPIEASTMAKSVVGILIKSIPLLKVEATNPPISVITPPPILTKTVFLSAPSSVRIFQISTQELMFFSASPDSISMISMVLSVAKNDKKRNKHNSLL